MATIHLVYAVDPIFAMINSICCPVSYSIFCVRIYEYRNIFPVVYSTVVLVLRFQYSDSMSHREEKSSSNSPRAIVTVGASNLS